MTMMKRFEDLRFAIGLFFAIVALILFAEGILHPDVAPNYQANLDLMTGAAMAAFSILMLCMAFFGKTKVTVDGNAE
jgi:hypothetical protein